MEGLEAVGISEKFCIFLEASLLTGKERSCWAEFWDWLFQMAFIRDLKTGRADPGLKQFSIPNYLGSKNSEGKAVSRTGLV